jgi:hypothetical protein
METRQGDRSLAVEVLVETRAELPSRLRRSQGFAVETESGRFGTVEDFQAGGAAGVRGVLVVRSGWLGRRRMKIRVEDVAEVLPRQGVVRLRSRWMTMQV